jgi:hypothetical protein
MRTFFLINSNLIDERFGFALRCFDSVIFSKIKIFIRFLTIKPKINSFWRIKQMLIFSSTLLMHEF